jgi:uncharacterized protein
MKCLAAWPALACALLALHASAGEIEIGGYDESSFVLHVTSLKEARFARTIHQQYDFSCGSATVATLLTYQYGYPVSEQTAFVEMFQNGNQEKIRKQGFSLLDIRRFLATHGFEADGYEAPLEKLAKTNTPAIVLITEHGYHHFVVVKGLRENRVLIGDPATGTRAVPLRRFEEMWEEHVVFVIHSKHREVRFNDPLDWRVAPGAPLFAAINRDGLYNVVVPKHGPNDF